MFAAVITSVSAAVLSASIIGGARAVIKAFHSQRDQQKARDAAIDKRIDNLYSCQLAFGHDRIYAECLRHLHNSYITTADLDNMMYLMQGYENVGGDKTAHILWERVKHLPIDDDKEPEQIRGSYPDHIRAEIKQFKEA